MIRKVLRVNKMIQSLSIQNIVLVDQLTLSFSKGFTVFTGETGAGKSILLDALGLALGNRADLSLLRPGQEQACISVTFDLRSSHPVFKLLEEKGLPQEEGDLTLRRTLSREGKSRCFVNDHSISLTLLKEVGQTLVEIHGQFDHLLDSKTHGEALDRYGGYTPLLEQVQKTYHHWKTLESFYLKEKNQEDQLRQHQDYLIHVIAELEEFNPQEDEEEKLHHRKQFLLSQEKVLKCLQNTLTSLKHHSPLPTLIKDFSRLPDLSLPHLEEIVRHLDGAFQEQEEAIVSLEKALWSFQKEEWDLEKIDDRLHQLRSLARKHRCTPQELPPMLIKFQKERQSYEERSLLITQRDQERKDAFQAYQEACLQLTKERQKAALSLEKTMEQELPFLKLGSAQFKVFFETAPPEEGTSKGQEKAMFHVSTNRGSPFQVLSEGASGGELSRLMLALKVILANSMDVETLLFDEIDSGTGGAVAAALGDRLFHLSKNLQVWAVTHSPQVAARGDTHFKVIKTDQEKVQTTVLSLSGQERQEEIARMLAGTQITEEARLAAGRLMA